MEYDTRMVREVLKRVEGSESGRNLKVIQGDVLKVRCGCGVGKGLFCWTEDAGECEGRFWDPRRTQPNDDLVGPF